MSCSHIELLWGEDEGALSCQHWTLIPRTPCGIQTLRTSYSCRLQLSATIVATITKALSFRFTHILIAHLDSLTQSPQQYISTHTYHKVILLYDLDLSACLIKEQLYCNCIRLQLLPDSKCRQCVCLIYRNTYIERYLCTSEMCVLHKHLVCYTKVEKRKKNVSLS